MKLPTSNRKTRLYDTNNTFYCFTYLPSHAFSLRFIFNRIDSLSRWLSQPGSLNQSLTSIQRSITYGTMDRSNFARALRHNHQDVENYNYSWYAYHLSPVTSNVNFQGSFQEGFQVDVPRWFSLIFNLLSFIKLPNDQGCKYPLVTIHVSRTFLVQHNFVTLTTRSWKVERFLSVKKERKKEKFQWI